MFPCYDSGWFCALQLLPPAPEVLAEIKTTFFWTALCLLILRLELSPVMGTAALFTSGATSAATFR